jgi:heme-degrading monooxygenase HmoA
MKLKSTVLNAIAVILMFSCTSKTETKNTNELNEVEAMKETLNQPTAGTIMQIVKAKTGLSEEEFFRIAKEREPQFKAIPGLIQKYYIKTKTPGEYGGVYIWDSIESLNKYKESDLAATIGKAYNTIEPPSIEIVDIVFELRE